MLSRQTTSCISTSPRRADVGSRSNEPWQPLPFTRLDGPASRAITSARRFFFLAEAKRWLRPGGRLILTVPFAARWHDVPFDYWKFTPSGLKYLLDKSGFTEVEVYRRGNALTLACYKVIALIPPLLMPHEDKTLRKLALRTAGSFALSPLLAAGVVVVGPSLLRDGGDDPLGYTVFARRPASQA